MTEILVKVTSWLLLLPGISVGSILEIVTISFLAHELLVWIKNTRAWNLLKELLVILAFVLFAAVLHLTTTLWILENIIAIAVTALLVIFQPKLRKALEQLENRSYMSYISSFDKGKDNQGFNDETIDELVRATFEMVKVKTGALIVIEWESSLKEMERAGIEVNDLMTSQLLISISEHDTSPHDGAVIIRGNHIAAATRYLPLIDNMSISKALDTRHRAVVGVSESMDNIITVMSEKIGEVPVAEGGVSSRIPDAKNFKKVFSNVKEETASLNRLKIWKGRLKNGKKAV